jgi:branched-chain amino acid transport system permease protein
MAFDILIQVVISGLLTGGLYALIAFGLSLIYGVARILNFAHGTLLVIAGIAASILATAADIGPFVSMVLLAPLFFVAGYLFYRVLLHPLSNRNHVEKTVGTVLVTVGALIVCNDVAIHLAGPQQRNIPAFGDVFEFGNVILSEPQIYIFCGIVVLTLAIEVFLRRSWLGLAVRAVTQHATGAKVVGIRGEQINALTFAVGSALAAIAGILYAMNYPVDPNLGLSFTVKAFTIIVFGGIGSLVGALSAGLMLGVAEAVVAFYWGAEWAPAISIILLLGVLLVFPQGVTSWRTS